MLRKLSPIIAAGTLLLALPAVPSGAVEDTCPKNSKKRVTPSWPPAPEKGQFDIVHFGEGHWNEGQGPKTMPIIVQDITGFDPEFVLFSSDMADVGSPDRLGCFKMLMDPLLDAGIPWFNSPGNHDRVAIAGPGGVANGSIDIYRQVFASMPAPWGDGKPASRRFHVPADEPDDGEGASTHYFFDWGPKKKPAIRVIALDNSQQGLTFSDPDQYPAVGPDQEDPTQLSFLERVAGEVTDSGMLTFAFMHQPTQDPRDPSNVHPVSVNHTMGKGASPDNAAFDATAIRTGIDAVLLGHIQGNAVYRAGETEYYIDGGGGGTPYAAHTVGTNTGYYYGFRILRVFESEDGWDYRTYFVPLVDRIEAEAPKSISVGEELTVAATVIQPFDENLEPRFGGAPNEAVQLELRPVDSAFADAVPELAYVYESSNPSVLRPVGDIESDDPLLDAKTMSLDGRFEALRPGSATVSIRVGTHIHKVRVVVRP